MDFFWIFFGFFVTFWIFWDFWIFWIFGFIFLFFLDFFLLLLLKLLMLLLNVTTGKCYYWTPQSTKMGQNSIKSNFFAQRAKKASAKGQSPPQELEVGPRSGPYLLVEYYNVLYSTYLPPPGVLHGQNVQSTAMYYALLCYTVLCCTMLPFTVLCCTMMYYARLYCTVLQCSVLNYCAINASFTQLHTALQCSTFCWTRKRFSKLSVTIKTRGVDKVIASFYFSFPFYCLYL